MVLYTAVAAVVAWMFFLARRNDGPGSSAKIALLFTFSGLLAFRILMNMRTDDYPIFYNGPVVLSFLLLACYDYSSHRAFADVSCLSESW